MPQLDFTTILPQTFWFIVIFLSIYTVLIHFFLPNFIKLIKTRKNTILVNEKEVILLKNSLQVKQSIIKILIHQNFINLKTMLETNFLFFSTGSSIINLVPVDTKIISVLYYNSLYCDMSVLNSITLAPCFLNLKI